MIGGSMSLRIFLCCSVILGAVPPLSADIFTGGTTTTGSVAFQYAWDNCSYSAALCPTGGTTPVSVEVPFSFQISLPSTPESALTGATLALSLPSDSGPATITSETSTPVTDQLLSQYSKCTLLVIVCLETTYYATYSNYNYAPNLEIDGSAAAYVDSITSPGASWTGLTNAGSLDLQSLGFGADSLYGGVLTVSGYLQLGGPSAVPNEIFSDGSYSSTYCNASYESSNLFGLIPTGTMTDNVCATLNSYGAGFNADTNFDLQYSDTTSEDGTLTLVTAPEPATVVLFSGVLALLALRRFRMRRVEASERR
jgi:hypothetical protein